MCLSFVVVAFTVDKPTFLPCASWQGTVYIKQNVPNVLRGDSRGFSAPIFRAEKPTDYPEVIWKDSMMPKYAELSSCSNLQVFTIKKARSLVNERLCMWKG